MAVKVIGGVLGALIIQPISDELKKWKPFLILCMAAMLPGLVGLSFFTTFGPLIVSGFIFGFFIMSAGPIGFRYGAEKNLPATESISKGLILLAGQISGILFVIGANFIGIDISMLLFMVFISIHAFLTLRLSEPYHSSK